MVTVKGCSVSGCTRKHKARGYCSPHYSAWQRTAPAEEKTQPSREERFWAKVDKSGECWGWEGTINEKGYGGFHDGTRTVKAHRFAYELASGPLPPGLVVDHTCHNESGCTDVPCSHRACVNPGHLEAVTQSINSIRGRSGDHQTAKTHCPSGHEYNTENTIIGSNGRRRTCRTCANASSARYYKRKAA